MNIKKLPETERPYEKLELYGEKALSDAELLAIILKTGTKEKTSVELAQELINLNQSFKKESLSFLRNMSIKELMQIKGMGRVKAIQVKAVCELSARMNRPTNYKKVQVKEPKDIANLLMPDLKFLKREVAKVIILNIKNIIENIVDISQGGTNFANISIKEVLNVVIKSQEPKFIMVHNHPSGDSTPSRADIKFTETLYNSAKIMGLEFLDHIIIGNMEYTSIMSYNKTQKI